MNETTSRFNPLPGFKNWVYDVHEIAPGSEQVNLYRDSVLRFSTPAMSPKAKMLKILMDAAALMEFDIQRRFSRRLYGFDVVRGGGILADVANENIRKFLAQHAVPLKQVGVVDCGILQIDVAGFLRILEKEGRQVLSVESYKEASNQTVIACGERWHVGDMRTPTASSLRKNLASVRSSLPIQQVGCERQLIYSFIIDSRDVVDGED